MEWIDLLGDGIQMKDMDSAGCSRAATSAAILGPEQLRTRIYTNYYRNMSTGTHAVINLTNDIRVASAKTLEIGLCPIRTLEILFPVIAL